jgi:hypothetical protein
MSTSPLLDTTSYTHVHSPWIQSVREFLKTNGATIYILHLAKLTKHRVNDSSIMSHETYTFTKSDMECVNACRLFLQVNFLSEISDNKGTQVLQLQSREQPIIMDIRHYGSFHTLNLIGLISPDLLRNHGTNGNDTFNFELVPPLASKVPSENG